MLMAFQVKPIVQLPLNGLDAHENELHKSYLRSVITALLWLLLYFTAATGLGRAFVQEEERGTALALRLSARATTVWAGKFALNALLQNGLALVAAPLLVAAFGWGENANFGLFVCVLLLGNVGIAAVFTMTSALVAQASAKGGLLAVLSMPLLVPLFVAAVHGTRIALGEGADSVAATWANGAADIQVLASYAVASVAGALFLFDFVWND